MNPLLINTDSSFDPNEWICEEVKARLLHRCGLLFRLYLDSSFNSDPAYQGAFQEGEAPSAKTLNAAAARINQQVLKGEKCCELCGCPVSNHHIWPCRAPEPKQALSDCSKQALSDCRRNSLLRVIHDDWTSRLITNDEFAHLVDLTLCY